MNTVFRRIVIVGVTILALVMLTGIPAAAAGQSPSDQAARVDHVVSSLDLIAQRLDRLERDISHSESVDPSPPRLFLESLKSIPAAIDAATRPLKGLSWQVADPLLDRAFELRHRVRTLQKRLDAWPHTGEHHEAPLVTDTGLGTGSISGNLTDAQTGDPIPFTQVEVYCLSPGFNGQVSSDASGHYVLTGLEAGTCYVRTRNRMGYIDEIWDDIPCPRYCSITDGTPITVVDGSETTGIDFALELGGGIRGTVTDQATGDPLVDDGNVYLFDDAGNYLRMTTVDEHGVYRFPVLTPGSYHVRINSDRYLDELYDDIPCEDSCDPTAGTPITVTSGSLTDGIDFALQLGGSFSGNVTNEKNGRPISGAYVRVFDHAGGYVTIVLTGDDGYYSVEGLPAGTYYVEVWYSGYITELYDDISCDNCDPTTGTPITVALGAETPGIDVALGRGSTISGGVTSSASGAPLPDSEVRIYDQSGYYLGSAQTNSIGAYTISLLYAGTYHVTARESSHIDELYDDIPCQPGCDPTSGTPITVPDKTDVGGIDFALDLGGIIEGTITSQHTGARLPDVSVAIFDGSGTRVGGSLTDSTGVYHVPDLMGGTYFAVASPNETYLPQLFDGLPCDDACDPTTGTPISVTLGEVTGGVDFDLTGGYISGRVVDAASAAPLYWATVRFFDDTGTEVCVVHTGDNGNYESCALKDGNYFVRAEDTSHVDELYDDIACDDGCDPTTGTAVSVTVGAVSENINFAMTPYGTISGHLTDSATGSPLSNIEVEIYDASGYSRDSVTCDDTGTYTSRGLKAGTYFVVASSYTWDGYAGQLYDGIPCEGGCDPTTGTAVTVTDATVTGNIDFALHKYGMLSGRVTDAATGGAPTGRISVVVYDGDGNFVNSTDTDYEGYYQIGISAAGQYYVTTGNGPHNDYIGELYDNIPCDTGCDPTTGTPITMSLGAVVEHIDFALARHGRISGHVVDATQGGWPAYAPLDVVVYGSDGTEITSSPVDEDGFYSTAGLVPGDYFLATRPSGWRDYYLDELYDDIPCDAGCNPTTGTPVTVTNGTIVGNIDFSLMPYGRISGRVTDSVTGGDPFRGYVGVAVYDESGTLVDTTHVDGDGRYTTAPLPPASYFLVAGDTYPSQVDRYVDELYDDIPCNDECSPTTGTPVAVTLATTTQHINFVLDPIPTFDDVPLTHWAFDHVETIYHGGVMGECDTDPMLFCPATPTTRAEMAHALLVAIEGRYYQPPPAVGLFDDVPVDHPFAAWIEELASRGITTGCTPDHHLFCPEDPVTRAQMAAFLLRTLEGPLYVSPPCTGIFQDVPCPGFWGADYVEDIFHRGITTGCTPDHQEFCPTKPVTRAQTATFLTRTFPIQY